MQVLAAQVRGTCIHSADALYDAQYGNRAYLRRCVGADGG